MYILVFLIYVTVRSHSNILTFGFYIYMYIYMYIQAWKFYKI